MTTERMTADAIAEMFAQRVPADREWTMLTVKQTEWLVETVRRERTERSYLSCSSADSWTVKGHIVIRGAEYVWSLHRYPNQSGMFSLFNRSAQRAEQVAEAEAKIDKTREAIALFAERQSNEPHPGRAEVFGEMVEHYTDMLSRQMAELEAVR